MMESFRAAKPVYYSCGDTARVNRHLVRGRILDRYVNPFGKTYKINQRMNGILFPLETKSVLQTKGLFEI